MKEEIINKNIQINQLNEQIIIENKSTKNLKFENGKCLTINDSLKLELKELKDSLKKESEHYANELKKLQSKLEEEL